MLQKGDKRLTHSWAFYDWANSVYSLVISTAVFPRLRAVACELKLSENGKKGNYRE